MSKENKTSILTDESLMPWGKYQGDKMINVPASYLIWLYDNNISGDVKAYIKDNYDVLNEEVRRERRQNER